MSWVIVAGDFTPLGGMDRANHALARHLASRDDVHLVTHRAWPDLETMPSVTVHRVRRPFGRHMFGAPLLAAEGRRVWRQLRRPGAHAVVNGGNCPIPAINWVHYLHAAYEPNVNGSLLRRVKTMLTHDRDRAAEQDALRAAPVVICNSRRTQTDVVERVGVEPSRARIVYYGSDPRRLSFVSEQSRVAAKKARGFDAGRPLAGFIGALGDRRKGFDTLFAAWVDLCRSREWDVDLLVVGAGAELTAWRQRAASAGFADRIRFAGFRPDVPDLLAAFDLLVHPARYEAYGLSVHEAICRGVPAIVTATAGVAEKYSANLGDLLVSNPDDVGELRDRLRQWRAGVAKWRDAVKPLSDALRARTWDVMAEEIASASAEAAG